MSADELGLFEVLTSAAPEDAARTPSGRRSARMRERQATAITAGQHPLTAALGGSIRLHADAPRVIDRDDPAPGPRCGSCGLRKTLGGAHDGSFPKCTANPIPHSRDRDGVTYRWSEYPRHTNGPGTDVRAWWPACTDYQPGRT